MLNDLFRGVFDSSAASAVSVGPFFICLAVALLAGAGIALTARHSRGFSHSFLVTLFFLPALTCVTIMMVNGNVGAGVATAGAFSLVRFRSAAGTAREIALIFLSMVCGLVLGMGYVAIGVLFALLLCAAYLLLERYNPERRMARRSLRITVPEDLDYEHAFDEPLNRYCAHWELKQTKTTNMGSLFRLSYDITLKPQSSAKALIDELRCLNGNLEIAVGSAETASSDL